MGNSNIKIEWMWRANDCNNELNKIRYQASMGWKAKRRKIKTGTAWSQISTSNHTHISTRTSQCIESMSVMINFIGTSSLPIPIFGQPR